MLNNINEILRFRVYTLVLVIALFSVLVRERIELFDLRHDRDVSVRNVSCLSSKIIEMAGKYSDVAFECGDVVYMEKTNMVSLGYLSAFTTHQESVSYERFFMGIRLFTIYVYNGQFDKAHGLFDGSYFMASDARRVAGILKIVLTERMNASCRPRWMKEEILVNRLKEYSVKYSDVDVEFITSEAK